MLEDGSARRGRGLHEPPGPTLVSSQPSAVRIVRRRVSCMFCTATDSGRRGRTGETCFHHDGNGISQRQERSAKLKIEG